MYDHALQAFSWMARLTVIGLSQAVAFCSSVIAPPLPQSDMMMDGMIVVQDSGLFGVLLLAMVAVFGTVLILGALTFFPALALGPLAERGQSVSRRCFN